jgi:hypothetical protein
MSKRNKSEMSSNKRQKTDKIVKNENKGLISIKENKDSFNRFADNLVEELLNYLPLKEKLIFTSVNKQFNKCLFIKQLDLIIDQTIGSEFNSIEKLIEREDNSENDMSDESEEDVDKKPKVVNKVVLNWFLKNCKFINEINFRNCLFDNEIIESICNYCQNLKVLKFMDKGFDEKSIVKLGKICGKQLEKIVILAFNEREESGFVKTLLNYCSNLKQIYCENIETFINSEKSFLPKLEVFDITINEENKECLKIMADKYEQQMKNFDIFLKLNDGNNLCEALDLIKRFVNLEFLSIFISFDPKNNCKPIDESIKEIAINCQKIKFFRIDISYCSEKLISGDLLTVSGMFQNVTQIHIYLPDIRDNEEENDENNPQTIINKDLLNSNINCFKNCKNLTKLVLTFSLLDDTFLEDINQYLPNLSTIHLSTAQELTDETMFSLSKLIGLKFLKIAKNILKEDTFPEITDSGVCQLLNSCPNIETIVFEGRPDITPKTIETLIKIAKENPKRNLKFLCSWREDIDFTVEEKAFFTPIDMKSFNDLPQNLIIELEERDDCSLDEESFDEEDNDDSDEDFEEELSDEDQDFDFETFDE